MSNDARRPAAQAPRLMAILATGFVVAAGACGSDVASPPAPPGIPPAVSAAPAASSSGVPSTTPRPLNLGAIGANTAGAPASSSAPESDAGAPEVADAWPPNPFDIDSGITNTFDASFDSSSSITVDDASVPGLGSGFGSAPGLPLPLPH